MTEFTKSTEFVITIISEQKKKKKVVERVDCKIHHCVTFKYIKKIQAVLTVREVCARCTCRLILFFYYLFYKRIPLQRNMTSIYLLLYEFEMVDHNAIVNCDP